MHQGLWGTTAVFTGKAYPQVPVLEGPLASVLSFRLNKQEKGQPSKLTKHKKKNQSVQKPMKSQKKKHFNAIQKLVLWDQ